MKLSDRFDGSSAPFEGDRTSILRSLPAGAQIRRATVVVSPIDATRGLDPFAETISFERSLGDWGATKRTARSVAGGLATDNWVEVDFHHRRTLAGLRGTSLNPSSLQVDLGGAYVEINANGGLLSPAQDDPLTITLDSATLPGLNVTKLKLTAQAVAPTVAGPDLTEVTVRSAPSNLSLRLGQTSAFWTHVGEMTQAETTPDFAVALQGFLADAEVENGFYVVPLVLHSDTIARLTLELEVEYLLRQSVLPEGVDDVLMPFDFGGAPKSGADALLVAVPANSRVAPRGVNARVSGAFEETRIVYAPTEGLPASGACDVSPATSQAQPITPPGDLKATAFDLLLQVERTARLQLDVRRDLDGKPDSASLLPVPVAFEVAGPVGRQPDPDEARRFSWVSVPLPAELRFRGGETHWLVLQSIDGAATWRVAAAPAASPGMQRTQDGGLSWRETGVARVPGAVAAFYRLRRKPERFEMPVALKVGEDERAVVVSLERFQPSGRVDFTLDIDEVALAVNKYLDEAGPVTCAGSEHLANGDFEKWQTIGDEVGGLAAIPNSGLDANVVAFSPDGRVAYVGGDDELRFVDAACDEFLPDVLGLSFSLRSIVIHPDGSRAYVVSGGDDIVVIDLDRRKVLEGRAGRDLALSGLAISPEGRQLFVAEDNAVWVVGATDLEQSVITGKATLTSKLRGELGFPPPQRVNALAVAPDGRRLYVALSNLGPNSQELEGEIRIYDAATLAQVGDGIRVGRNPSVIALTPDGKKALVVNRGGGTVSILDTQRRLVVGQPVALDDTPVGAAVLPDGRRAFVIHQESSNFAVIDLERQTRQNIPLPAGSARELAVSPQGDRVYLTTGGDTPLISVPLGVRLPVEWNSSGRVRPTCLPAPSHVVAVLGSVGQEKPMPASISQVVPVAGACAYEFSFWGLANQPDALAELFWLGGGCALTRADSVPIKPMPLPPPAPAQQAPTVNLLATAFNGARVSALLLHRARFESPPGATQVEVRFSTPEGVVAVVEKASLTATAEALINDDFRLIEDGQINGWTLSPTPAPGATLVASEGALRLRNAGADEVGLTQTVAVKGGRPFELEFQGGGESRPGAPANPRLEVRWLGADGAVAGDPATLNIVPTGFGSSSAIGVSPAAATQAEIRLIVPPGFAQEIRRVSLRFPVATLVPITFVAQAPGELTVSDLQVTFEQAEPKPPAIPPEGLCASTPPGRSPGGEACAAETEAFCHCCGAASEIKVVQPVVTPAGRPAQLVRCVNCGTEIVRVGGARVAGAETLASTRLPVRQPVVHSRRSAVPAHHHHGTEEEHAHDLATEAANVAHAERALGAAPATQPAPAPEPLLTDISGIGATRAQQLAEMGFDSVSKLAAANPQDLTRLRLVTLSLAEKFVAKAKELTAPEGENTQ